MDVVRYAFYKIQHQNDQTDNAEAFAVFINKDFVQSLVMTKMSIRILTDMQMDVFKRVVRMDNAFFAKRTTGTEKAKLERMDVADMTEVYSIISNFISPVFFSFSLFINSIPLS